MAQPPGKPFDDSWQAIQINDFSGGLVTLASSLSLQQNQSPAMLNCIPLPGRLMFRGGYVIETSGLPGPCDQAYSYFDADGDKHYMVWSDGDLYDCVTGVPILVEAACYTAGYRIGVVDGFGGILLWSSGGDGFGNDTVPLRYYNAVAGTAGAVVTSGDVDPPASDFLFMYGNQVVALAPFWGAPLTADRQQNNVHCWCDPDDYTAWIAANSFASGPLNSGKVVYGQPFGLANIGFPAERTYVILRNDKGIYAYTGALGEQVERLLNCPWGCRDAMSAQYVPSSTRGVIMWLSNDGQIWQTDGTDAKPISSNVLPTLQSAYNAALANDPDQKFYSGYNHTWQYYFCDVAGQQFVYRWATDAWTMFSGWVSGPFFQTLDNNNVPAYYIASNDVANPALCQIALLNTPDNGTMPSVYWTSPVLHAGDIELLKEFFWGVIATYDTGVTYNMAAESIKRINNTAMTARTVPLVSPAASEDGIPFVVGSSLLGGSHVLSAGGSAFATGTPVIMQGRFACEIENEWYPEGSYETLKGTGVQVTISYGGGGDENAFAFDLLGLKVLFLPRGYLRGAGAPLNAEALSDQSFDPFVGPFTSDTTTS